MSSRASALTELALKARRAAFRVALRDLFERGAFLGIVPLAYAVLALSVVKVAQLGPERARALWLIGLVPLAVFVGGTVAAWFRSRPEHVGALALDRRYGLEDRVTSALSFLQTAEAERTPLMKAAIDDALVAARDVSPREAVPFRVPRDLPVALALCVVVLGVAFVEVRTTRVVSVETRPFEPMAIGADDVELFREMAAELSATTTDPETLAAVRRFNQLVEDIAARRLDRREAFRRLEELESKILPPEGSESAALEEGLAALGKELKKSELANAVARALDQKRLADAEKAMKELAEKLRNKTAVDKAKIQELRKALETASKAGTERQSRVDAQRRELEEERKRLLKKKQEQGLTEAEKQALEKNERQLAKLDRQRKEAESARSQLSDLDRDLAKASEELAKELGLSANDLDQAAQDMNRTAQKQMTEQEKEELKRRIQELREILRQQGKGGLQRMAQIDRFGRHARGQGGQTGRGGSEPQGGQKGQQGQGSGNSPGGGTETILVPMPGGVSLAPGPGGGVQQGGDAPGPGGGQSGRQWGTGHDPKLAGDKTSLDGRTHDVTAAAADTGQGASASEVIYAAADRGFVGRGYKKVFTEYKTVAEQVINQDEIPSGYRFYVRRYFQLIRPRD